LGAGTGIAARALTTYFSRVIAVEPDPLMAKEFRKASLHATLRVMAPEEYVQSAGSIDLVNVAGALHWMDAPRVIANIVRWLRPGAVLAVYSPRLPSTPPSVGRMIRRESNDHWRRFRLGRLPGTIYACSLGPLRKAIWPF